MPIQTILGILMLAAPLLLIGRWKHLEDGIAHIIAYSISWLLLIAIATQALGIFTYPAVAALYVLGIMMLFHKMDFRGIALPKRMPRIDWMLVAVIVLVLMHLIPIHFSYSGKVTTILEAGYQEVESLRYPYPYYSDEWYSIAFIRNIIETRSLPFQHPLIPTTSHFINLEFAFHSFLAGFFLLLGLDPLAHYVITSTFFSTLICVIAYLFVRRNTSNSLAAAFAALSIPYITNAANLPGIWTLIPIMLGIVALLLGIFFMASGDKKRTLLMAFITLLFYPPLAIFYTVGLLNLFAKSKTLLIRYTAIVLAAAIAVSVFYFLGVSDQDKSLKTYAAHIWSTLYYPSFTPNATPHYNPFNIIPLAVIPLALAGLYTLIRKKPWFLAMIAAGASYWIAYSFVSFRFIIEYQRAILVTSILVTIAAGFGMQNVMKFIREYASLVLEKSIPKHATLIAQAALVALFAFLSFSYTQREAWHRLYMTENATGRIFHAAAPANIYLHPSDLEVFKDIQGETFLSIPWKGTVIGVATGNYPISTKPGTITLHPGLPSHFVRADCIQKTQIMNHFNIRYVYLPPFECPGFVHINTSAEGLALYSFDDQQPLR